MFTKTALVFLGGGLGAIIREGFMLALPAGRHDFPFDILAANLLAAFLLGLAFGNRRLERVSDNFLLFVGTGIMGGMSTFSSFVYGAYTELTTPGEMWYAVLYVLVSAIGGYLVTALGIWGARQRRNTPA